MESLTGVNLPIYIWVIIGLSLLIAFKIRRGLKIAILAIVPQVLQWLDEKTKNPRQIASSALVWTVVIISSSYIFLFGFDFSIRAWQNMLTTHRGLIPFIGIACVSALLITSVWRSNLVIEPKWQTRLLILMPIVIALSFVGHFLFFGIVEEKLATSQSIVYIEKTLPAKYATLTPLNRTHKQKVLPWEAVRIEIIENNLYNIQGEKRKADMRDIYYTFNNEPTPINPRSRYVFLTNNGDESVPLTVGIRDGSYEGSFKIGVRYCDKIASTGNRAGCPP